MCVIKGIDLGQTVLQMGLFSAGRKVSWPQNRRCTPFNSSTDRCGSSDLSHKVKTVCVAGITFNIPDVFCVPSCLHRATTCRDVGEQKTYVDSYCSSGRGL